MKLEKIVHAGIASVRYALFTALLFLRPALRFALNTICAVSLFCFLFILAFMRHETTPMYAFAGLGLGATLVLWLYDMGIALLAPAGYRLVTEL